MTMVVTSPAFKNGGPIPVRHTCDGDDLSPALTWTGVPDSAKSLALICDDPDAPMKTWVHWVIFNIPPTAGGLAEGVAPVESLPDGSLQGRNDFGRIGYGGPCPPRGPAHRYFFKLYALDTVLSLKPGASKGQLEKAMEGHILATGTLMGTYQRKK